MIIEVDFQHLDEVAEGPRGCDILAAGLTVARGMVVRQDHPTRIQVEGTSHRRACRQHDACTVSAQVFVLGKVEPILGEIDHKQAFLALMAEAFDEMAPELRRIGQDGLAFQCLA